MNEHFPNQTFDWAILLLRLVSGGLMLIHGIPKLNMLLSGGEIQFANPLGLGMATSLILAVFAEVFCSILILLGVFTRLATIPLIITMLVAALITHGADPFGKKELALMYLTIYVAILLLGSGKFSLSKLISVNTRG